MDDSFEFDLDLGLEDDLSIEGSSESLHELSDVLGVDDSFILEFEDDESGLDLEIDLESDSDDLDSLSLSVGELTHIVVDMAALCFRYRPFIQDILDLARTKEAEGAPSINLAPDEFPTMSLPVFNCFARVASDTMLSDQFSKEPPEQYIKAIWNVVHEETGWYPGTEIDLYSEKVKEACERFKKIRSARYLTTNVQIADKVDLKVLEQANLLYSINSHPFRIISYRIGERVRAGEVFKSGSRPLPVQIFGSLVAQYLETTVDSLRSLDAYLGFTVDSAIQCVFDYLTSDAYFSLIGITSEEGVFLELGERVRRLLLRDLKNRTFRDFGQPNIFEELEQQIMHDSISAEILLLLGFILNEEYAAEGRNSNSNVALEFLHGIQKFVYVYRQNPSSVNPHVYESISVVEDGYELSYTENGVTKTVIADDCLIQAVGVKTGVYTIPLFVESLGALILPPENLITAFSDFVFTGRSKVSKEMVYLVEPTLTWLEYNDMLVTAKEGVSKNKSTFISDTSNQLWHMMLQYDNQFNKCRTPMSTVLLKVNAGYPGEDYVLGGVCAKQEDSTFDLLAIEDSHGKRVGDTGYMSRDSESGQVFVQFASVTGDIVELSAGADEYEELYLGDSVEVLADTWAWSDFISDFSVDVEEEEKEELAGLLSAVRLLADVAGLSYDTISSQVKQLVARDLFHVLHLEVLDKLLAVKLLSLYRDILLEEHTLDLVNTESLTELLCAIYGSGSPETSFDLTREGEWERISTVISETKVTMQSALAYLRQLDLDGLAMHTLSYSHLPETETSYSTYLAVREVPGFREILLSLEARVAVLLILQELGERATDIFSQYRKAKTFYIKPLTRAKFRSKVSEIKSELPQVGDMSGVNYLEQFMLFAETTGKSVSSTIKLLNYFILEGNLYNFLCSLEELPNYSSDVIWKHCSSLVGGGSDFKFSSLEYKEFETKVPHYQQVKIREEFALDLINHLQVGIRTELLDVPFSLIKAYALFLFMYKSLFGSDYQKEGAVASNSVAFLKYAGSFVVSYCPVVGGSSALVLGGDSRPLVFTRAVDDFVFTVPLSFLNAVDLEDLRVVQGIADYGAEEDENESEVTGGFE